MIQYLVVLSFKHMRVKIIGEKMLAQCPNCKAIKMEVNEKYCKERWQQSIAEFNSLKKELCYGCNKTNRV